MRIPRIAALLLAACPAWGAFPWYLTDNFANLSNWTVLQGYPQGSAGGLLAWNGALLAPLNAPPGGWTDYEVQGTVTGCWSAGPPTYNLYARMSQDATSYYVLSVGSCTQSTATITLSRVVSGVWTTLTSFPHSYTSQILARLVVRQNKIIAWADSAGP